MQATDDDKREFESAVSNLLLIMEPSSSCHEALETTSILPSEIVLDEEISSDAEKEDSEMLAVDEFFKNDPSESSISALGIDFADTLETSSTEAFNTQIGVKITKRRLNSDDNIGQRKLGRPFDPIRTSIPRTPKGVKQVPAYFNVGPIDIAQIKKKPQKRESGEDDISCISPNCTYKNKMSELKLHEGSHYYFFVCGNEVNGTHRHNYWLSSTKNTMQGHLKTCSGTKPANGELFYYGVYPEPRD